MTMTMTRRRFLCLTSAACLASVAPAHAYRWQGIALGAKAQIILDHPEAARIVRRAEAEIARLEGIFSLYRRQSELSRLNAEGRLAAPSFELLDCLGLARRIHATTKGRFDPTVQPLWRALARAVTEGRAPDAGEIRTARAAIGLHRVFLDSTGISLGRGQALTLNGIAQGYIADRIALMLQGEGIFDVLIDTGEIMALGRPKGQPGWPVSITQEAEKRLLSGRAIATSAMFGMTIGADQGHILDPRGSAPQSRRPRQVSVSAASAGLADGLSTGLSLTATRDEADGLIGAAIGVRIESYIL